MPNNNHFDTTRANIEVEEAEALDLVIPEGRVPARDPPVQGQRRPRRRSSGCSRTTATACRWSWSRSPTTRAAASRCRSRTSAASGALCDRYRKPFFLDACRFAENAWFIKLREPGQADRTPKAIAQEMFSLADGCTMSAKKDGLANIGGFLAMNNDAWAEAARNLLILTEGFPTYGGLAGYDLEAIARGLEEVVEEAYLRYRIRSTEYLGEKLIAADVPIIRPAGRARDLPRRAGAAAAHPAAAVPGHRAGQRALRRGGHPRRGDRHGDVRAAARTGPRRPGAMDLVRLAIPRRVYTQSHIDYVAEAVIDVAGAARAPARLPHRRRRRSALRHFTAIVRAALADQADEGPGAGTAKGRAEAALKPDTARSTEAGSRTPWPRDEWRTTGNRPPLAPARSRHRADREPDGPLGVRQELARQLLPLLVAAASSADA